MRLPELPIPDHLTFSEEKVPTLLFALGNKPILVEACEAAQIHPMALELARMDNSELGQQIDWAMNVGFGIVEQTIANRAIGIRTPKTDKAGNIIQKIDPKTGETVVMYDEIQSDKMLDAFSKRMRPDLYGDKVDHNVSVKTVTYMPADVLEGEFEKMLDDQRKKTDAILDGTVIDAEFEEVITEAEVEAEVEDLV